MEIKLKMVRQCDYDNDMNAVVYLGVEHRCWLVGGIITGTDTYSYLVYRHIWLRICRSVVKQFFWMLRLVA